MLPGDVAAFNDRKFLRRLLLVGHASTTLRQITGSMRVNYEGRALSVKIGNVRALLVAMISKFPRIAVLENDELTFRGFPDEEGQQKKLHNELMRCARISGEEVSDARIAFLRKRPGAGRDAVDKRPRAHPEAGAAAAGEEVHG